MHVISCKIFNVQLNCWTNKNQAFSNIILYFYRERIAVKTPKNEKTCILFSGLIKLLTIYDVAVYLKKQANLKGFIKNLYFFIISKKNLISAWWDDKFNKNQSFFDNFPKQKILFSFSFFWTKQTHKSLKLFKYIYKSAKRVVSIKKTLHLFESFIIENFWDKIIQKAFLRVLNIVYEGWSTWEKKNKNRIFFDLVTLKKKNKSRFLVQKWLICPVFKHTSHGHRFGRSAHSAIKHVWKTWGSLSWFVNCGIEKMFDSVNKRILISQLKQKIKDQKVMNELYKMMSARIINFNLNKKRQISLNVPEGSVLSLFLFNVYMHAFDVFIFKTITKYELLSSSSTFNSDYWKFTDRKNMVKNVLFYKKKHLVVHEKKNVGVKTNNIKENQMYQKCSSIRMFPIRYADDILLGFDAKKNLIKTVINEIFNFLKKKLYLNSNTISFKHAKSDYTPFLGFYLQVNTINSIRKNKKLEAFKRYKAVVLNKSVQEYQSYLKMVEWLGRKTLRDLLEVTRNPLKPISSKKNLTGNFEKWLLDSGKWATPLLQKNNSLKAAHTNRNLQVKMHIERWVKSSQTLLNSNELKTLQKFLTHNLGNELLQARKQFYLILQKVMSNSIEKNYIIKSKNREAPRQIKIVNIKFISKTINIFAPVKKLKIKLCEKNIINSKGMPCRAFQKLNQTDYKIIVWYNSIARSLLDYYGCASNHMQIRKLVNWSIRYSLLATLGAKHKRSVAWAIQTFGLSEPKIVINKKVVAKFFSKKKVTQLCKKFLKNEKSLLEAEKILQN